MRLTTDDVDKWDSNAYFEVLGASQASHQTLKKLGDTLTGSQASLADWDGHTSEAWHENVGKTRVDINDHQQQAKAVSDAIAKTYQEIDEVKRDLRDTRQTVQSNGWKVKPDWTIDTRGQSMDDFHKVDAYSSLQSKLNSIGKRADEVDDEIASEIRRAVKGMDVPKPQDPTSPKPKPDESVNAAGKVAGPDGDPPYGNGATATVSGSPGDNPPMTRAAAIPLADNPPGYDQNMGAGAQRDQAWKDYLNGKNADGTQRAIGAPLALPKPEAVRDKALRSIGAAGRQQGVSYAWGGNQSLDGPSRGHKATAAEVGQNNLPDESWTFNDNNRIGYDCGGLVRFSYHEGAGIDVGVGTNKIDSNPALQQVRGGVPGQAVGQYAQPGDILVYGNQGHAPFTDGSTHHTGIYVGNGYIINAPGSGNPVGLAPITGWRGQPTDILRLP